MEIFRLLDLGACMLFCCELELTTKQYWSDALHHC